jgi:excisionase family DNA binding protein
MQQPAATPFPLVVAIRDAARMLAVGRTTLYELIASGQLATIHIGRAVRIPVDDLRTFVNSRSEAALSGRSSTRPSENMGEASTNEVSCRSGRPR